MRFSMQSFKIRHLVAAQYRKFKKKYPDIAEAFTGINLNRSFTYDFGSIFPVFENIVFK